MNAETNPDEEYEILFGGAEIEVTVADHKNRKTTRRRVKIAKIAMRQMTTLGMAYGKIADEARVYLGDNDALVENLTDESLGAVVKEGRRLNAKSFTTWFDLQKEAAERLTGENLNHVASQVVKETAAAALASPKFSNS